MSYLEISYWIEEMSPLLQFYVSIISALVVGLSVVYLGPPVRRFRKAQWKKRKKKQKELQQLVDKLDKDQPKEVRRNALLELGIRALKRSIPVVIVFALLAVAWLMAIKVSDDEETSTWQSRQARIEQIDKALDGLWFRTNRNTSGSANSAGKENDLQQLQALGRWLEEEKAIGRNETLCKLRASLEAGKRRYDDLRRIGITALTYQACMLEGGWFTERCTEGESECAQILYSETICTSFIRKWLKQRDPDTDILVRECIAKEKELGWPL